MSKFRSGVLITCILLTGAGAIAQSSKTFPQLKGLDAFIENTMRAWNVPGIGIGIVVKDSLIFSKGYGYRDYGKKLPVTAFTQYQIASNTKLFTSIAAGMLVEDGKLEWDRPVKTFIPSIQFFDDNLDNQVTMRDMLAHRTGISRHDMIWYKSDFNRKELFDRLKYLEPSQPLRERFLYNNMMYAAAGYAIELLSGKSWEDYVRQNIFNPLGMKNTVFEISDIKKGDDYVIPYNERRDSSSLFEIPLYEETAGLGPAGSIISTISDMSRWLIALMNDGRYHGKQVLSPAVLNETLRPAIAQNNSAKYTEILNPVYGMGRGSAIYRGHTLISHGGDLPGIHSQVSYMPNDSIGVIIFVIGDQGQPLYNILSYSIYERMLGMDLTPWSERRLQDVKEGKEAARQARAKAGAGRVAGTKPSHNLEDYSGFFENAAYGILAINKKDSSLHFDFHKIQMPLTHFHYDRFDTPNDENFGMFSVNFQTNPQGDIDRIVMSLDEAEATFIRKADPSLKDPKVLARYIGKYEIGGSTHEVIIKNKDELFLSSPGSPLVNLIPYKPGIFRIKEFSDVTIEFKEAEGKVTGLKYKEPTGEYELKKQL